MHEAFIELVAVETVVYILQPAGEEGHDCKRAKCMPSLATYKSIRSLLHVGTRSTFGILKYKLALLLNYLARFLNID